jgi:phytol kinase
MHLVWPSPVELEIDLAVAGVYLAIVCTLFGLGELVSRRWRQRPIVAGGIDGVEAGRKLVHLMSGAFIAVLPYTGASALAGMLVGGVSLLMLKLASGRLPATRGEGPLAYLFARRSGAMAYAIALVLMSALFFDRHEVFAVSFVVLALADPAAAWVGITRGRRSFLLKSWEGFLAHLAVAIGILLTFFVTTMGFSPGSAALAAVTVAVGVSLVEAVSSRGLDNLTIPIATAAGVTLALATAG